MANAIPVAKTSDLLKGWRTLKGEHYCPACWKKFLKDLPWQKALEQNSASMATNIFAGKDEVIQSSGYVLCIG